VPADALMGADVEAALEHVNVPSYVIDRVGIVRWMNPAARALVGDRVGQQFTSVVAPEDTRRARELFARKIMGNAEVTDAGMVVVDAGGAHVAVEISSVPLRRGEHVVGVFGQVSHVLEEPQARSPCRRITHLPDAREQPGVRRGIAPVGLAKRGEEDALFRADPDEKPHGRNDRKHGE
jgi:PAS domain S-box-containing protein